MVADQLVNVSAIGESRNSKFGRLTPQRPLADWPQGGKRSDRKSVSKRENWLRELLISSKMCLSTMLTKPKSSRTSLACGWLLLWRQLPDRQAISFNAAGG